MSDSVRVLDSTLADEHLALLRDRDTPSPAFRRAVGCLTTLVIAEALRDLEARESTVTTPMAVAHVRRAARRITVIPILRAGLAMLDPALALMPERARVGFLGMARDEATLKPRVYLESIPDDLSADDVVALDVMVATGGSCVAALDEIAKLRPASLRLAGLIAAPEGLEEGDRGVPGRADHGGGGGRAPQRARLHHAGPRRCGRPPVRAGATPEP